MMATIMVRVADCEVFVARTCGTPEGLRERALLVSDQPGRGVGHNNSRSSERTVYYLLFGWTYQMQLTLQRGEIRFV
jgi:hypothetical protein